MVEKRPYNPPGSASAYRHVQHFITMFTFTYQVHNEMTVAILLMYSNRVSMSKQSNQ